MTEQTIDLPSYSITLKQLAKGNWTGEIKVRADAKEDLKEKLDTATEIANNKLKELNPEEEE